MTLIAQQTRIDPLHAFIAGAFVAGTPRPIPLTATRFDVAIDAGLATVATTRTFRNAERGSIEATITFPVPVHATLLGLVARIGGRTLAAKAQRKQQARESYEAALDRGKTAILHEEVLRGVHMLSVGHIPPGAEIEVRSTWAMTLMSQSGPASLRIPLTVGDIYGRSGLPDSDELVHGGPAQTAALTVECRDGSVALHGGRLVEGRAQVPLNAPIDLAVTGWMPRERHGRAADGRDVVLRVEPAASADAPLDVAVLVDHSGSMAEICSAERGLTKHQAVIEGLGAVAETLAGSDIIDLWEFDDAFAHVGSFQHAGSRIRGLLALIGRLRGPAGGTEIGHALAGIMARSTAKDLLLITDGKSHALDVHALAQAARRIAVVLVGEDSLEANVGHLAALTGGEIFVAAGADLTAVLAAAVRSLRVPHESPAPVVGAPQQASVRRAGMKISAAWQAAGEIGEPAADGRAVAAFAASLVLPALPEEAAAQLAEAEGLVTHLTSLILVDEAAAVQEGIPATRKVALPTPRTTVAAAASAMAYDAAPAPAAMDPRAGAAPPPARGRGIMRRSFLVGGGAAWQVGGDGLAWGDAGGPPVDLASLAARIDWDRAPQRLQAGDLSMVDRDVADGIREAAAKPEVVALATELDVHVVALVIGLMARSQSAQSRSAARVARAVLDGLPAERIDEAARILSLQ